MPPAGRALVSIPAPIRIALAALVVAALAALLASAFLVRPHLTAAERGRRLAEANGCFACHGPEGTKGAGNPGRSDRTVPSFGSLMMYASSPAEVREWIANGVTTKRAASETWRRERDLGALRMPAFGERLSKQQIDDLVAFVLAAANDAAPDDSLAAAGLERAEALGCVGCHGAGGRYARRNPGSLKGYVPPWDGEDWAELVGSEAEFREWVELGVSRRFEKNPVARYFLNRAVLKMPAYRNKLEPGDVEALWAYIGWLRASRSR